MIRRAFSTWLKTTFSAALISALCAGCGSAGQSLESVSNGLPVNSQDVTGSIGSFAGSQSQMAHWVVILLERDTNVARVAEVTDAGIFTLRSVNLDSAHTIMLASPEYVFQSVLTMPGDVEKTVHQYFRLNSKTLPRLIQKGHVVSFQDFVGVTPTSDFAVDMDGDTIPDGMAAFPTSLKLDGQSGKKSPAQFNLVPEHTTEVDTDNDTVLNYIDPDIDGDGIPNVIDSDDDGDTSNDIVDLDANGDLYPDASQSVGDSYFPVGIDFFAVQFESNPQDDGTTKSTIQFTTQIKASIQPIAVAIRGPSGLLNAATVETTDVNGAAASIKFDRFLMDDGLNQDSSANDRLMARRITLEAGKAPRANQMMFAMLAFGDAADPWYMEFPYTFAPVSIGTIAAAFDKTTKKIGITGTPFGAKVTDFMWSVIIYNPDGLKVWESASSLASLAKTIDVQDNVVEAGVAYKFVVAAQLVDKVPGYPTYTVRSKKYDLSL